MYDQTLDLNNLFTFMHLADAFIHSNFEKRELTNLIKDPIIFVIYNSRFIRQLV